MNEPDLRLPRSPTCDGSCWNWESRNSKADGEPRPFSGTSRLIWVNPDVVHCQAPGCHMVNHEEWISDHVRRVHPELVAQMTEQHRLKLLETIPLDLVRCPFCLSVQKLREMGFFLASGDLSKRRLCRSCNRTMEASSPTQFMQGPLVFARFVAGYPGFWQKITFEKWIKLLNDIGAREEFDLKQFWEEYRRLKPKREDYGKMQREAMSELTRPGEERLQENWRKRAAEEKRRVLAESNTKLSETDDVDERGT